MYIYIYIYIYNLAIGLVSSMLANCPGDRGSIPGRLILNAQKIIPPWLTHSIIS